MNFSLTLATEFCNLDPAPMGFLPLSTIDAEESARLTRLKNVEVWSISIYSS